MGPISKRNPKQRQMVGETVDKLTDYEETNTNTYAYLVLIEHSEIKKKDPSLFC